MTTETQNDTSPHPLSYNGALVNLRQNYPVANTDAGYQTSHSLWGQVGAAEGFYNPPEIPYHNSMHDTPYAYNYSDTQHPHHPYHTAHVGHFSSNQNWEYRPQGIGYPPNYAFHQTGQDTLYSQSEYPVT